MTHGGEGMTGRDAPGAAPGGARGSRIVNIFANGDPASAKAESCFKERLGAAGFDVPGEFSPEAELIVCIGGDGSLLNTLARLGFPDIPIIGVNTGHLGFFQELQPHETEEFISIYLDGGYKIQSLKAVSAEIIGSGGRSCVKGLNEIVIRGAYSHVASLNIYIGDSFIETFRGDGIAVATPAGSTAYNYALGGSIVDPRLDLLQVTPIAPINNSSYRSFTSGILLPPHMSVNIFPEYTKNSDILIAADGIEEMYSSVAHIHVAFSESTVQLLRLPNYDFWNKVKTKLL